MFGPKGLLVDSNGALEEDLSQGPSRSAMVIDCHLAQDRGSGLQGNIETFSNFRRYKRMG